VNTILGQFEFGAARSVSPPLAEDGSDSLRSSPYEHNLPLKEQSMNYSNIQTSRSARDDALKRRSNAVREALGMGPAPQPDAEKHPMQKKKDENPAE